MLLTLVLILAGCLAGAFWLVRAVLALSKGRRGYRSLELHAVQWSIGPLLLIALVLLGATQAPLRLRVALSEKALTGHVESFLGAHGQSHHTWSGPQWVGLLHIDHTRVEAGAVWLSMGGFMFDDTGLLYLPDGHEAPDLSRLSCWHLSGRWWQYHLRD